MVNIEACLYVGNIHPDVADDVLYSLFSNFGKVVSCKVMMNAYTHVSRQYGYVQFANVEDAKKA